MKIKTFARLVGAALFAEVAEGGENVMFEGRCAVVPLLDGIEECGGNKHSG